MSDELEVTPETPNVPAPEGTFPTPQPPANIVVKYVTNGQSYPVTIADGTSFEQFISTLSNRAPEIVANQNIRTITRAGVWTAQLIDYSAGNVHPNTRLQQGDIITASGKIDAGK